MNTENSLKINVLQQHLQKNQGELEYTKGKLKDTERILNDIEFKFQQSLHSQGSKELLINELKTNIQNLQI